jgi:hypothetical protein
MTARKLTPQEAAEMAVAERGLGAGGDDYAAAVRAIELYEASRKRVELTPEQAKAFETPVEVLEVYRFGDLKLVATRNRRDVDYFDFEFHATSLAVNGLRQLAAVLEHLATNLEEFPS